MAFSFQVKNMTLEEAIELDAKEDMWLLALHGTGECIGLLILRASWLILVCLLKLRAHGCRQQVALIARRVWLRSRRQQRRCSRWSRQRWWAFRQIKPNRCVCVGGVLLFCISDLDAVSSHCFTDRRRSPTA